MSAGDFHESITLILLPFLAGSLALLSHLPLGGQVLKRGIVFIDLAIAQIAALGALIGAGAATSTAPWAWQGTIAAILGAGLIALMLRQMGDLGEALIGLIYIAAAAVAVLWVSNDPHGGQILRTLASGDILWTQTPSILALAVVAALTLSLYCWRAEWLGRDTVFYPLMALVVSVSVPALGLYLVFTALIAPALSAELLRRSGFARAFPVALLSSMAGLATGLLVSVWTDLPAGPCAVLGLLAASFVLGAVARMRNRSARAFPSSGSAGSAGVD